MRKNIYLFYLYHLFTGLWLFSALAVIYFQEICHSYTLAIWAYSMISITSSILEIPLGVISDRLGRKPNLILSSIFLFLNMLFWALAGYYESIWMLFAGSFCRGIGVALHSGTDVAFLFETTKDLRCLKIFDKLYANAMSYNQMGLLISAICGMVVTFYLPLIYLVWLSVLPAFAKLFLIIFIKEPKSNFDVELSPWQQIKKSIQLIVKRKKLRNYTYMKILTSGLMLSIYRFEILYYAQLIPLYLINVTRIITHTTGYLSFILSRLLRKIGFLQLLFYSNLGMALVRIIGLMLNNALTPFVTSLSNLGYGMEVTAQAALMQKEYNKSLRATMNSLTELMCGISIVIIGYFFGVLADYYSPRSAILIATIAQIGIAIGYKKLFKTYLPIKTKAKLAIK